ncbi:unnamed protein product [Rhizoctonia solani]|uniref:Nephrocystin 3-like N-terminal domain-containing protein n=1 Tax=Rhizoctonia solani TaxID=456999 RepID=A0A8H2XPB3_9AGAM|nr:unnamed protein product [Rhizoctonia solani]
MVWEGLEQALDQLCNHLSQGVLSPLQPAIELLLGCVKMMEATADNDTLARRAYSLIAIAETLTPYLNDHHCSDLSNLLTQTVRSIHENVAKISEKRKCTWNQRFLRGKHYHEEIAHCWEAIECALRDLQLQVAASAYKIVDKDILDKRLESLNPSKSACYGFRPPGGVVRRHCAKGTRVPLLRDLNSWSGSQGTTHLRWMNGMAGTGKTTIAYTFAQELQESNKLVACFFCSRLMPELREVDRIIPTIAYQLARLSEAFGVQLCNALDNDPELGHSNISRQFDYLLKAPLRELGQITEGIVVVIDALDECAYSPEASVSVDAFVDQLITCAKTLPLKVLLTSRPEPRIRHKIKSAYGPSFPEMMISLHDVDRSQVQADIKSYLTEELALISLSDAQILHLVQQCNTLFIYAATLVRYINPSDTTTATQGRLDSVLQLSTSHSSEQYTEIDKLYHFVLNTAFGADLDDQEANIIRIVLRTVLCAQEPISTLTIAALCGHDDSNANNSFLSFALERLRSVVYVSETSDLVSVFHASFPDFLFTQKRSAKFFCDRTEHNLIISRQCFKVMKNELRFNICGLESSYAPDEQYPPEELHNRINNIITPPLWYACRYWAQHLQYTANRKALRAEMKEFLSQRLLFWMEVLNLKRNVALGADILFGVASWLMDVDPGIDAASLLEDARNFVTGFAANPVSVSTPHIYLSLLPFCPRSSAIFRCYSKYFRSLAEPDESVLQLREIAALGSWRREAEVTSVRYSPDGTHIAYGCLDGTVGLQNSYDGTSIFTTSRDQSHDKAVWSVAFSPRERQIDNKAYIVSGSNDGTIRTWNPLDGTALIVIRPLSGEIKSVAASTDGTIASGASDGTVCIWDSSNGKLLFQLIGHSEPVWSVAFSPDGTRLASGSDDHTIRLWDPLRGELMLGPLKAQTSDINTIVFSPDGTRMASGSTDRTVCVWDPDTGTVVLQPFVAHNDKVTSVRFSPNGKYLASGSMDRTIRVWDPVDGKLAAGPFEGHIGPIYSIAFSPDNTRIISGSPDQTIRIWDPRKGTLIDGALQSHSDAVFSVSFSPDGQHMASCSFDGTLRVWEVLDSVPVAVGNPLRGHTNHVTSLAFSPDCARVVTGSADRTARVWDIFEQSAPPILFEEHKGVIWSVAFSPDGHFVASASGAGDNTIWLWDPNDGSPIAEPLTRHTNEITAVAISPDGKTLTSGSRDKTLRVWDLKDPPNSLLLEGHTQTIWSVVYSHDGSKLASCSADGTIRIWNPQNGTLAAGEIQAHSERVNTIAFSPDSQYIASGSDDCSIRVWDTRTGGPVSGPYEGHLGAIWSVAYSPSGNRIVSGSHDGTIRIWDVDNNAPTVSTGDARGNAIAGGDWELHPDGWIKHDSDLLLWVPPEVARSLITPHCLSVISSCGPLRIDFSNLQLGKSWQECYVPQPDK